MTTTCCLVGAGTSWYHWLHVFSQMEEVRVSHQLYEGKWCRHSALKHEQRVIPQKCGGYFCLLSPFSSANFLLSSICCVL